MTLLFSLSYASYFFLIELIKDILVMAGRQRHARNKAVITAVRSQ